MDQERHAAGLELLMPGTTIPAGVETATAALERHKREARLENVERMRVELGRRVNDLAASSSAHKIPAEIETRERHASEAAVVERPCEVEATSKQKSLEKKSLITTLRRGNVPSGWRPWSRQRWHALVGNPPSECGVQKLFAASVGAFSAQ